MSPEQECEILSTVHSDLDSTYSTPLKTKIAMIAQDTLNAVPVIKGIDITTLKADIDLCISKIAGLESEVSLNKSQLYYLQKQLNQLTKETEGTVLGKLVVLKEEN